MEQTDPDGKFTIKTTASNAVLIFIFLQTQEVNTAGKCYQCDIEK
jgi:hypothetical protein